MVDCEKCKHKNDDDYCYNCEHNEIDFYDKYDPWSEAELKEIEKAKVERAIAALPTEIIAMQNAEQINRDFLLAKKFACSVLDRLEHSAVYFIDNQLIATDTRRLIIINCDNIPEQLNDRFILTMDDNGEAKAIVENGKPFNIVLLGRNGITSYNFDWTNHAFRKNNHLPLINTERQILMATKSEIRAMCSPRGKEETLNNCQFGEVVVVLNKKYLDEALDLFEDDEHLELKYADPLTSIIIKNDRILMLILPIRAN